LRSNHSQEGGNDGKPLANGSIKRSMAKHIQEDLESFMQGEVKLLLSWAIMEHLVM